jgi:hypothetical protein
LPAPSRLRAELVGGFVSRLESAVLLSPICGAFAGLRSNARGSRSARPALLVKSCVVA